MKYFEGFECEPMSEASFRKAPGMGKKDHEMKAHKIGGNKICKNKKLEKATKDLKSSRSK
jgi:hypothetical protein